MERVCYEPIGIVESPFSSPDAVPRQATGGTGVRGCVHVRECFRDGLLGLDGFSHLLLISHLHAQDGVYTLQTTPQIGPDRHLGVFATRSPARPNPIGISIVNLVSVSQSTIEVDNIDLIDDTPILDIKPFAPKAHELTDIEYGWMSHFRA